MNRSTQAPFRHAGLIYHDLTHAAPMFQALDGDLSRSDMRRPIAGSEPVCGHGGVARIGKPDHPAARGYFQWGVFSLDEHYGTHIDSQCHFITTAAELRIADPDRRFAHQLTLADLIGPLVYIDISDRVEAELRKNEDRPSPDTSITDFGDDSRATVRLSDVEAIEDHIVHGAYLVISTGWECTYRGEAPDNGWYHPYLNGLNHPGVTPEVVDWLIRLEDRKGFRINGFVADNIAVESGESLRGPGGSVEVQPARINGPYLHAVGLQRGWKLVENAANLRALKSYAQGSGTLMVGASRIAGVSGAPARVIAIFPESRRQARGSNTRRP